MENIEYICVEMADDHPAAIQRAAIKTKDLAIATKDDTIAAKTDDLLTKDAAIKTKDLVIATKDDAIAAKDADIAANNVDIAAKDATIAAAKESNIKGEDDVESGAAVGIAVATFFAGLLIGTIIISMILCPAARQQKAAITKSTTSGVKVEQVGQVGV